MSNYVTEEIYLEEAPNPHLLKEEVKIEENQDIGDADKGAHKRGQSPNGFQLNHSETSFSCEVCGKKFQKRYRIKLHIAQHSKDTTHKCWICGCATKSLRDLSHHIRISHPAGTPFNRDDSGKFPCEVCGKKFEERKRIKDHMVRHNNETDHKCWHCGYATKSIEDLTQHIGMLHPTGTPFKRDDNGDFSCEVCGQKFQQRYRIKDHMTRHGEERYYKCGDCSYAAKTKWDLIQHIRIVHPAETPFRCEVCLKSFALVSLLNKHSARHNKPKNHKDRNEEPFKSDQCSNTYKCTNSGDQHNNKSSRKDEIFKCNDCGYSTKRKGDLTTHVNILHPTETPFRCEVCSKSFSTFSILKRHSAKHGVEKPFKCDQCSDAFKFKTSFNNHKALAHGGGGKFPCEACGKKFLYRAKLKEHVARHSEERNYKCSDCEYAAKTQSDLEYHMAKHSHERNHKCNECRRAFKTKSGLSQHFRVVHHSLIYDPRKQSNKGVEEIDLKVEPTVIYDPEEIRDISNVKQEPEEEVKKEPEYMEEL